MPLLNHLANKVKHKARAGVSHILNPGQQCEDDREEEYLLEEHRYQSFAPIRQDAMVKYFIDGHDYCWAVSEAIESAEECIFIEDWWLSPELYLRRPPAKYPEYRIDALLKRKAEQGVMIYIVVYKEVELAMTLDSAHTKKTLQGLHENIRHPDHAVGGTFFWSHHEKFVIVDNRIGFLGGIDLCYGRWDTHAHRLADFNYSDPTMEIYPGQDYSDARLRDFEQVKNWDMRLIDKSSVPRMPWHDISLCMLGQPVLDLARHFCDRWNFVKHSKSLDKQKAPFLRPPLGGYSSYQSFKIPIESRILRSYHFHHNLGEVHGTCQAQILRSSASWSSGIKLEKSIQNAYIDVIKNAKHYIYIENQFFITTTEDDTSFIVKNQIGAAIVERIVRAFENQEKFKVFVLIPLMPAFPAELSTKEAATARLVMYYQYISICSGEKSIFEQLKKKNINPDAYIRFYSLRSYDRINKPFVEEIMARNAGFKPKDVPIPPRHKAGEKREQLPPTPPAGFIRPEQRNEPFHLRMPSNNEAYVATMSIAPDAMNNGQSVQREPWVNDQQNYQPRTEMDEQQEIHDYVTEELYIHAKLLIADDSIVIMGSANLNDRSQCGDRDSEVALIVEDNDFIQSKMNNKPYQAGRFAATLRRQLWKEHLGLINEEEIDKVTAAMLPLPIAQIDYTATPQDLWVMDPLDEETLNRWNNTAATNTKAFRQVFHCVPDDMVTNWEEYHKFYPSEDKIPLGHVYDSSMSVKEVRNSLDQIQGHLVEFPTKFLSFEDLQGDAIPVVGGTLQDLYT
ncbi:phospholipase D/nuclease [Backusella circina FSU 941]|nr:phospholipase D/nuclease [Backusella circina FSU 941]